MYRLAIKVFLNMNTLAQGKRVLERDIQIPKDNSLNVQEIIRTMHLLYGGQAVVTLTFYIV